MNARGFVILLLFAVAASVVVGLVVERFTAPGWERTFWFAVGLGGILFPAGRFAERRGWIHGFWQAGPARDARPTPQSSQGEPDSPATRQTSGDSR
ncbi:MAG: hypothetical protein KGQ67_02075 [Betaproteobacteria bacterium]|nr:hypothetical protein [Betaproteobacteria bacterium]